jgi:hypothetical protein
MHITIAPVANVDPSFSSTSRRPSLVGDGPRRLTGESVVPQTSPSRWVHSVVQVSAALKRPTDLR